MKILLKQDSAYTGSSDPVLHVCAAHTGLRASVEPGGEVPRRGVQDQLVDELALHSQLLWLSKYGKILRYILNQIEVLCSNQQFLWVHIKNNRRNIQLFIFELRADSSKFLN